MRGRWYVAGGVLAVLLVGACSHSSTPNGAEGLARGDVAAPGAASKAAGGGYAPLAPEPARAGSVVRGGPHRAAGDLAAPLLDTGYKIRTARMTVAVKAGSVAAKATQAGDIATGVGGEIDSDNRTTGPHATASLTLRVPPEALMDTLTALSRLGTPKGQSLSTTDVTQKVADVDSRVESAQRSIARLRVLFDHARKIGDIIALESELNAREADLESLQAQQRSLAHETAMATITLTLITAAKPVAPPKSDDSDDKSGFIGGLQRGWDGFTGAAAWVAGAVGTLLPFVALLLLIAFGARTLWPRLRPTRRPSPTPAPIPSE